MAEQDAMAERSRLLRLATNASFAIALSLIVLKLGAWWVTGSVVLLASLVDSIMDAGTSALNWFAVRVSLQPADDDHRFGHAKAEALGALAQAGFIAGSGVFLTIEAIQHFIEPAPLNSLDVGMIVLGISLLLTVLLLSIQHYVMRRTTSIAIEADSLHYATDLAANLAGIAALFLAERGFAIADPIFGLLTAGYIFLSVRGIAREAIDALMDKELEPATRKRIVELAYCRKEVLGLHDLRTRKAGDTYFIQLHLELDDALSLHEAHDIADDVEASLLGAFPGAQVIVHQDPISMVERDKVVTERPAQPIKSTI